MPFDATQPSSFEPDDIPADFWDIVRRSAGNSETLQAIMMQLPQEEVLAFARNFTEAATQLKDDPFLQHVAPGTSEDGMDDIANWVVSQGKEAYTQVWQHPETIPKRIASTDAADLYYVAEDVYYERFGEMPDPD